MAAYRRAFVDASRLLKQGSKAVKSCSRTVLHATQVRSLMVQQSSLVKRANVEFAITKQAQKFSCIPRIMSSAVLSSSPVVDGGLLNSGSSSSSDVLEGSSNDEEGLVTPAMDPSDDL